MEQITTTDRSIMAAVTTSYKILRMQGLERRKAQTGCLQGSYVYLAGIQCQNVC